MYIKGYASKRMDITAVCGKPDLKVSYTKYGWGWL
jgi:hypothetical protein